MKEYIEKSALVAEINTRIMDAPIDCYGHQRVWAYNDVKDIINNLVGIEIGVDFGDPKGDKSALSVIDTKTLEVKEVDLNEEIEKCLKRHLMLAVGRKEFTDIAKTFFELGLKAQKGE